ncbi:MAG: YqiJ family protein [Pseudomonadota bacterium]|nr:YqiJ family protein [Pseudomonadota bacterium]
MSFLDYNLPFAVAFALLILVALAQVVGLGDLAGEPDVDASDAGAMEGLASILGIGRVPFLAWLAIFLLMFSGVGVTGQFLLDEMFGTVLAPLPAAALAVLPALLLTAVGARVLSPIVPHDETTAVHVDALLGKRGRIDIGSARRGHPARAVVKDIHGQPHNIMVEPHEDGAEFLAGDEVLLVRLENDLFYAISTSDRRLGPVS